MEKSGIASILFRVVFSTLFITVPPSVAQEGRKDAFLDELRLDSTKRLTRFGQLLSMYAADNDGTFCTSLNDLGKYVTPQDDGLAGYVQVNVEYVGAGKTNKVSPRTTVVAYDTSLPSQAGGTNVVFADGHVEFVETGQFPNLGIKFKPRSKTTLADGGAAYEVRFADDWQPYVSAGNLRIIGQPFYAVRTKFFAASAHMRVRWSLTNKTDRPVTLWVQYRTTPMKGKGGSTGCGQAYALAPREERQIDDLLPIASTQAPVTFYIMAERLYDSQGKPILTSRHQIATAGPVQFSTLPANALMAEDETARSLVKEVRLARSQDGGNVLEVEVGNDTGRPLSLALHAAGAFPADATSGGGSDAIFSKMDATVGADSASVLRLPYAIPQSRPDPFLVFTLLECVGGPPKKVDMRPSNQLQILLKESRLRPLYWGWFDLREAAGKGLARLPAYELVKERIKLTGHKQSEHFLFRYRPGSYAEQHIETAVKDREEAYTRLSTVLQMQLPKIVTIDLYPDMEAKGLGSGTTWTHANTVTNTHIAEVYNVADRCDRYHELAHIFSYHFPGHTTKSGSGPLVEGFADFFEDHNIDLTPVREEVRQELAQGTLKPLADLVLTEPAAGATFMLFDFLIHKDVERFKTWYVRAISRVKTPKDLDKAFHDIYGLSLKELEQQWHQYLAGAQAAVTR